MFLSGPTLPLLLPRSSHAFAKALLRTLENGNKDEGLKAMVEKSILKKSNVRLAR